MVRLSIRCSLENTGVDIFCYLSNEESWNQFFKVDRVN
jgi:hypothetical protein